MIVLIETMVDFGLPVLSNHCGGITGVHYNVNNSLLILLHLQVMHVLTLYILHNIIIVQLGLYVAIQHGFYA